jgi:hypothetical protein
MNLLKPHILNIGEVTNVFIYTLSIIIHTAKNVIILDHVTDQIIIVLITFALEFGVYDNPSDHNDYQEHTAYCDKRVNI